MLKDKITITYGTDIYFKSCIVMTDQFALDIKTSKLSLYSNYYYYFNMKTKNKTKHIKEINIVRNIWYLPRYYGIQTKKAETNDVIYSTKLCLSFLVEHNFSCIV